MYPNNPQISLIGGKRVKRKMKAKSKMKKKRGLLRKETL
jgi:hypothetical protein